MPSTARAVLGILGVAAVGALLFDMLLLSQGLIVSMRDLLDRTGYDVRVTATSDLPRTAPRMTDVTSVIRDLSALPTVQSTLALRYAEAQLEHTGDRPLPVSVEGVIGSARPWAVLRGHDVANAGEIVVNERIAQLLQVSIGGGIIARASGRPGLDALPARPLMVAGIAEFPFELSGEDTIGGELATLEAACGENGSHEADIILV